jgi:hypothetical protein
MYSANQIILENAHTQDDGAVQTSSTSYLASFELTPPMAGCVCIQVTGMIEYTGASGSLLLRLILKKADSPSVYGLQHHVRINIVCLTRKHEVRVVMSCHDPRASIRTRLSSSREYGFGVSIDYICACQLV